MIRTLAAALALAAASVTLASAQPKQPQPAPQGERVTAELLVARVRPHLPQDFAHGSRLVDTRAEGQMVIMVVEVPGEWLEQGRAVFERSFIMGFCSEGENIFFDNGISVRIDTLTRGAGGNPRTGTVFTACPPRN
jgi:hypothetical protein